MASSSLSPWLKLLLLLSSLCSLSFALAYLHPFLTLTLPRLWSSLQRWFTAPILFVLLNLVVGALYLSSGMMPRRSTLRGSGSASDDAPHDASSESEPIRRSRSRREEKPAAPRSEDNLFVPAHVRLLRSKSDQVLPPKKTEVAASRLKKSGTFESTSHSKPHSGVVAMDYPENDSGQTESEEVDKQAEDFIGRFKQKMKLQRLDSFMRYQERLNKSYGPP